MLGDSFSGSREPHYYAYMLTLALTVSISFVILIQVGRRGRHRNRVVIWYARNRTVSFLFYTFLNYGMSTAEFGSAGGSEGQKDSRGTMQDYQQANGDIKV